MMENQNIVRSVCGLCHNACPINIIMEGESIVKVAGVPEDPRTKGRICSRGLAATQILNDPRRLMCPVKRKGKRGEGNWEKVSWDQALTEIAETFNDIKAKHGADSVIFGRGQAALWGFSYDMLQRLTHAFGTEPAMGASECFAPRASAEGITYGGYPMVADFDNTDLIILWGRQPAFSSPSLAHYLFSARSKGAEIISIDPICFHMTARSDMVIPIIPGTDLALALAMLHVIVNESLWDKAFVKKRTNDPDLSALSCHLNGENREKTIYSPEWAEKITSVPAQLIVKLARKYASTQKACILAGHGLEGRSGNTFQTSRAIAILRCITGHINTQGGDLIVPLGPPRDAKFFLNDLVVPKGCDYPPTVVNFNVAPYIPEGVTFPLLFWGAGLMPTPDVMRWMKEGKAKALFMQGGNPMVQMPQADEVRRIFAKLELMVVVSPYLSETAEVADIVLPASTFLERTEPEWFKYGQNLPIVYLRQKVAQIGDTRPDYQILIDLGRKLGFEDYFPSEDVSYYIDALLKPSGITLKKLREHPGGIPFAELPFDQYDYLMEHLPDKKINIVSKILDQFGFDALPIFKFNCENLCTSDMKKEYPLLAFTGRAGPMYTHCQFRTIPWLRELRPEPLLMINARTAEKHGIDSFDSVILESPRGSIRLKASVTERIAPNLVYLPGGWANANFHTIGGELDMDPISSQSNYMSCLCRIRKAS